MSPRTIISYIACQVTLAHVLRVPKLLLRGLHAFDGSFLTQASRQCNKTGFLSRIDDPDLLAMFDLPEIERQIDTFRIAFDRRSIVTRVDCL